MADGSITFDTSMNNKQLEVELQRTKRKIQKFKDDIYINEQKKIPLVEQARKLGAELDQAKQNLFEMQNAETGKFETADIAAQKELVSGLQRDWNKVNTAIEACDRSIQNSNISMEFNVNKAGEMEDYLSSTSDEADATADGADKIAGKMKEAGKQTKNADTAMDKFAKRLVGLAKRVFVFSVITAGLRKVRQYLGEMVMQNAEAQRSVAQLRGALMTLAQPIVNAVIPAFVWLVNTITRVVAAIASLVSRIFGTTAKASADAAKQLNQQASGYGNVAKEAEKTKKEVMGFDELNIIGSSEDETSSGGGGGGGSSETAPDFSVFNGAEKVKSEMDVLLTYLSAAALAVGAILCFTGVNIPLGIALMAVGAAGLASEVAVNWTTMDENLRGTLSRVLVIVGGFALVIGAILCFSGANIPLGIGLMIIGAASLATAAVLAWGSVDKSVKSDVAGIMTVVAGALLVLGAILTFSGANIPLGIGLMVAGAAGLGAAVALNWDSIQAALTGPFAWAYALAMGALLVLGIILTCAGILPLGIALIVAGAAGLVTITALNWDAILHWCQGAWQSITDWWDSTVAPIFTIEWWTNKLSSIGEGLLSSIKTGINAAIGQLNQFIAWVNSMLHIQWGGLNVFGQTIIPPGSIQLATLPNIPYLAQGAVIPPNREFLAVLGDQKHGTNIEAPLDTIKQAVAEVMNSGEMIQLLREIAYSNQMISEKDTDIVMDGRSVAQMVTRYQNNMARAGG